jgi:hypothetical protein
MLSVVYLEGCMEYRVRVRNLGMNPFSGIVSKRKGRTVSVR